MDSLSLYNVFLIAITHMTRIRKGWGNEFILNDVNSAEWEQLGQNATSIEAELVMQK